MLAAASLVQKAGGGDLALQIEEFEYGRELDDRAPPASAWFGMARVRLLQKRSEEALSLIRNVTVGVGAPFENLPEAVRLLEEQGLKTQAAQYAQEWKTAEPWNENAQLAFASLSKDSKLLESIRLATSAPYMLRVEAARAMRDLASPVNGSDELSLLTQNFISPTQASQPFYVQARLDAARQSSDMAQRRKLYGQAIALDPTLRDARLQLAQAAFATGDYTLGLAAFNSYRNPYGLAESYGGQPFRYMPEGSRREVEPESETFLAVEQLAAQAYATHQQWAPALSLYHDLLLRVQDPAKRITLTKAHDAAMQKQELELANSSRLPHVTDDVVQRGIVKPKLNALPPDWISTAQSASGQIAPGEEQ